MKTITLVVTALIGLILALISAILVNAVPVNSQMAWSFAVSCIVGTWMFVGALLLIIKD